MYNEQHICQMWHVSESQQNHFYYLLYILNVTQWTEAHAPNLTAHRNSSYVSAACHNANSSRSDKWNLSDKIKTPHLSSMIQKPIQIFPTLSFTPNLTSIQRIHSLTQLTVHILHLNLQPWHWPEKNVNRQHIDHFNLYHPRIKEKCYYLKNETLR
jgi:hypothetical protein